MKITPIANYRLNTCMQNTAAINFTARHTRHCIDTFVRTKKEVPQEERQKFMQMQEEGRTQEIFENFNIKVTRVYPNGDLAISHYGQPKDTSFKEYGIDENELLKDVVKIEGDAEFTNSKISSLKKLKYVGGYLKAENHPRNIDFDSLEKVKGNVDITNSHITSMPNLKYIGGWGYFDSSNIKNLDSLSYVGNWLSVESTKIKHLPSIEYIKKDFTPSKHINNTEVERINGLCRNEFPSGVFTKKK